jgi:hypothetical protein
MLGTMHHDAKFYASPSPIELAARQVLSHLHHLARGPGEGAFFLTLDYPYRHASLNLAAESIEFSCNG